MEGHYYPENILVGTIRPCKHRKWLFFLEHAACLDDQTSHRTRLAADDLMLGMENCRQRDASYGLPPSIEVELPKVNDR